MSRTSTDPRLYCLVYTINNGNVQHQSLLEGSLGRNSGSSMLRLSAVTESCHRHVVPGVTGLWYFNFTSNGKKIIVKLREKESKRFVTLNSFYKGHLKNILAI